MSQLQEFLFGGLCAAMLAGCDPAGAAPSPEVAPRQVSANDEAPKVAPLQRGALVGGEPVERAPEWPSAADPDTVSAAELEPEIQRAVAQIEVPVLLPADAEWRAGLLLIPLDPKGYSLRARAGRSKLIVQASGVARLHEGMSGQPGGRRIRGVLGHLTDNEGIRSASWIERGIAYTADLECGDPGLAECSSEGGYLRLLDSLAFVENPGSTAQDGGGR